MREILFRGKRIDNGEWVKGYYSYETDECSFELHLISDNKSVVTEVVPETVGQYTGLKDKNGKKIFEGDICEVTVFTCEGEDKHFLCEVCFDYSSFIFRERSGLDILFSDIYDFKTDVEVIDNIYDNFELIGGEANG